jgi:hypothetical protein
MSPSSEWVQIEPGQYQWYAFKYDFDEKYGPMEIRMEASPADATRFSVRNGEQANLWRRDGTHVCFGRCAGAARDANKDGKPDYRTWSARMYESGTFYIVVERDRAVQGPVNYKLTLSGDGWSTTGAPTAAAEPAPVAAAPAAKAAPAELAGSGPDNAILLPTGAQGAVPEQVVEKGGQVWYYFDYTRDAKTETKDLKPIEIKLFSEPNGVATVTIRNGDDALAWRRDGTNQSFGACTCVGIDKDKDGKPDYAVWKGTLPSSGRYYIVVEHARNSDVPANYRFEVLGM